MKVAEEHLSLSALVRELSEDDTGAISVSDLIDRFGSRASGVALLIFALPNLAPLPPGSSTVLGLPLLIIAPQLAAGGERPWIPRTLGGKMVARKTLANVCRRASPWLARLERVTTHRLCFKHGRIGGAVIGVVCTLLATVLILPIPLGNLLPAAAIVTLALSLIQRDGLLALIGHGLALVSAAVLAVSGHLVIAAVARLSTIIGLW